MNEQENNRKARRDKASFPPHWKVRVCRGGRYAIEPWRARDCRGFDPYGFVNRVDVPCDSIDGLKALLAYYSDVFPHTGLWPVRFLNIAPVDCGRAVVNEASWTH